MRSKASIKKGVSLPAPKLKPTKPVRTDLTYTGEGGFYRDDHSPLRDVTKVPSEENKKNSQESRKRGFEENREKILELAMLGKSDAEIAAKTQYKESSVRRIITKLRSEGYEIPERERGRKCKEHSE